MRIETPFNEKIHRSMYEAYLQLAYAANIKRTRKSLTLSVVILLLGFGMPLLKNNPFRWPDIAIITFGVTYSLFLVSYFFQIQKLKKHYRVRINEDCERLAASNEPIVIEYDDTWFSIQNEFVISKIKWIKCDGYRLSGNNLYIDKYREANDCFIINKEYVGEGNFKELVSAAMKYLSPSPHPFKPPIKQVGNDLLDDTIRGKK